MKTTIQLLGITLFGAAVLAACGDDSLTGGGPTGGSGDGGSPPTTGGNPPQGGNDGGGPVGGNGGAPPEFPPPPEPGAQIDRMGRPAINTALNGAFVQYDDAGARVAPNATVRGMLQDGYNEDQTEADWGDTYGPMFIGNLAMIDSLDTGVDLDGPGGNGALTNAQACTNQAGNQADLDDPANYGTLGGLALPDDRIYVNVAAEDCSANAINSQTDPLNGFLGVEIATLLQMPAGCGGRRPIDDVIAITYSLLTIGLPAGIDDGITARPGQHPETFPYLAGPEQNDP